MTEWEPATEAEVAMRDALREGDQEQYFRILSRAELLLPVSADALAGRTPMGWGTWTTSGRTHVLAFTSSVALRACLADNAGSARRIAFHDLAAAWPHLEWWLAINPGLPVEGYLPAWFVAQLARGDVRLPGRAASNRLREHAEAGARARATVTVPGSTPPPQTGVSMPTAVPTSGSTPQPSVPAAAPPAGSPVHPSPAPAPGPIPAQMAAGEGFPGLAQPAAAPAGASTVAPTPTASGLPRRIPAPPPPPGAPPPSMAPRPPMPSPTPGPSPVPPQTGPVPPQVSAAPPQSGPFSSQVGAVPPQAGPVMAAGPAAAPAPDVVQSSSGVLAGEIVSDWGPPVVPGRPVTPEASAPPVPAPFAPPAPPPAHVPPPAHTQEAHTPEAHIQQAHVSQAHMPPAPVRVPQANVPPPVPAASARPAAHPPPSGPAATDFVPANEVEKNLLAAAGDGSTDSFLSTLLLATVLVPVSPVSADGTRPGEPGFAWLTETLDGEPFIVVFTSVERLRDHLGETIETIDVRFTQLIKAWPDPGWAFAVNPSTPVGAKLPGAQIIALASWADEVGLSANADDEPRPAAVVPHESDHLTVMQKTLPPNQVAYYLERGYDRVSGFVHRAGEVAHLTTPAALYAALGTAPAGATHNEAYVLRWPAHRPTLYRIPYGGPDEPAMRAMEGWVIERPPFRGNGFAPGESGDVIAEFKVDSVRLPHGAQLWRIGADGTEKLIALLDTDAPTWRRVGEH